MRHLSEDPTTADRCVFLDTVTQALAQSLDLQSTLSTIAGTALPYPGSWCIVDITEADGGTRRIGVLHPDPDRQIHARSLIENFAGAGSSDDALRTLSASTEMIAGIPSDITDEMLVSSARTQENLESLRALGIGSLITVPLVARGRVSGAITFISAANGHSYGADDMALAEDLAGRCAMALDNARMYADAQDARAVAALMNERLLVATLQQQALTDDARDANRVKSEFLAMMSHELRTPLNAIVGYADLIGLEISGPVTNEQSAYVSKIKASTYHLVGIIDDILDLAKIQAGRMGVHTAIEVTSHVIDEALALVLPQAAFAGIELNVVTADDCQYCGDRSRVRQILVNLLSNALKFTPRGGLITISTTGGAPGAAAVMLTGSEWWTEFRVEDTGVGISDEEQAHIFEPFVQLDSGKTRTEGGTGLGLTISRELAMRMGGELTVKSAVGEGSSFSLWLPAPPCEPVLQPA